MAFTFPRFRREFSVNFYKDLRFPLGKMSFHKNWVDTQKGDPYPLIYKNGEISEQIHSGCYRLSSGAERGENSLSRFAFSFFPYASYRIKVDALTASDPYSRSGVGFVFRKSGQNEGESREPFFTVFAEVETTSDNSKTITAVFGKTPETCERKVLLSNETGDVFLTPEGGFELLVTARAGAFDIYLMGRNGLRFVAAAKDPGFAGLLREDVFRDAEADLYIALGCNGCVEITEIEEFMDCGISQADMRPIRYENGEPMLTDGRMYFTMSSRAEEGAYQSVISWLPGSADFRLEGAIFYDTGDGIWGGDVAASVIYERTSGRWLVWYCSFTHGHILGCGETFSDLRHGINIIETTLMETEQTTEVQASVSDIALGHTSEKLSRASLSDDRLFYAKYGDEDPDFVYDRARGKWLMTICRPVVCGDGKNRYRYFFFESDEPFRGYVCRDYTRIGENTGGSIVNVGIPGRSNERSDEYIFVCGSDFGERSRYYKFELDDFSKPETLDFDYYDGGFRGWGTIVALPGSTKRSRRFAMITFDRHGGSAYNWSYGNIYVFTAKLQP